MQVNGRLNIVAGIQVTLEQSIPVIWYSVKRADSHGEKRREEEDEGEALECVFKHCIKRKKRDLVFDSGLQLGLWQVWGCAECLPKCSGTQGLEFRPPLFTFFLRWKTEGKAARTLAVSYETVTVSLHSHRRAKYICFMHLVLSCKAREYNKKENVVFFSAVRCWYASKILMLMNTPESQCLDSPKKILRVIYKFCSAWSSGFNGPVLAMVSTQVSLYSS